MTAQLGWFFYGGFNTWAVWVLDITTTGGTTQAYLITGFPGAGTGGTHAQSAALAAGLQSDISGVSGVTACDLTEVTMSGTSLSVGILYSTWAASFPAADWAMYSGMPSGQFTPPVALLTRFPADGILAQGDADSLAASVEAAYNALSISASLTMTGQVLAPPSVT